MEIASNVICALFPVHSKKAQQFAERPLIRDMGIARYCAFSAGRALTPGNCRVQPIWLAKKQAHHADGMHSAICEKIAICRSKPRLQAGTPEHQKQGAQAFVQNSANFAPDFPNKAKRRYLTRQ